MSDGSRSFVKKVEALMERFGLKYADLIGFRFAVNVFIATTIVWSVMKAFNAGSPIWAIASMVAASEPVPEEARRLFRSRIINVLVGCAVGMGFLVLGNRSEWLLPVALSTTVLISAYIVKIKTMWRQAPITAAIVIASALAQDSALVGIQRGMAKVVQVLFGCAVALMVTWLMSKVWLIKPPPAASPGGITPK
jgi:uncharacterized membrane protein YccC